MIISDKMKKSDILVSVIITTYNRPDYLYESLKSIAEQTFNSLEILLIDDGSSSHLKTKNKEISNDFGKCTYFYKPNTGQPDSRNFGIKRAKGVYIAFCDDDDFWKPEKIEKQINYFIENPKAIIVNCCMQYINSEGEKLDEVKCHEGHNSGYLFSDFLIKNRTSPITPLLRAEVFDKVGYFNPEFTIAEDWEFWRRISFYYNFYFIDEVLAYYRIHDKSMMQMHKHTPLKSFRLCSKLTRALILWGRDRFNKNDRKLIYTTEWKRLRKVLGNHYPGIPNKLQFLAKFGLNNIKDAKHLLRLFLKSAFKG